MSDFALWLVQELEARGWSRAELARRTRGGITSTAVDQVVNGQSKPGLKFARAVASAFEMPEEDVMRRAGILRETVDLPPRLSDLAQRAAELPMLLQAGVIDVFEAAVLSAERQRQSR